MWCEMPAYYTALQFSSSEGCLIRNKATVYAYVMKKKMTDAKS